MIIGTDDRLLERLKREADQAALVTMLTEAGFSDAVGASLSFLLHAADRFPLVLQAALRMRFEKPGVPGGREIIEILNQVAGRV